METVLIVAPFVIAILFLIYQLSLMIFKVSYYEQTLKNNRDLFSEKRWEHIDKIMKLKNLFKIPD